MRQAVIVGGARTAFGKLLGALDGIDATDLGGIAIAEALRRAGIEGRQVDYVIMGQVIQAGAGPDGRADGFASAWTHAATGWEP